MRKFRGLHKKKGPQNHVEETKTHRSFRRRISDKLHRKKRGKPVEPGPVPPAVDEFYANSAEQGAKAIVSLKNHVPPKVTDLGDEERTYDSASKSVSKGSFNHTESTDTTLSTTTRCSDVPIEESKAGSCNAESTAPKNAMQPTPPVVTECSPKVFKPSDTNSSPEVKNTLKDEVPFQVPKPPPIISTERANLAVPVNCMNKVNNEAKSPMEANNAKPKVNKDGIVYEVPDFDEKKKLFNQESNASRPQPTAKNVQAPSTGNAKASHQTSAEKQPVKRSQKRNDSSSSSTWSSDDLKAYDSDSDSSEDSSSTSSSSSSSSSSSTTTTDSSTTSSSSSSQTPSVVFDSSSDSDSPKSRR